MLIDIYLGIIGWKWTGGELQSSELFLMTSIIFWWKIKLFKYKYYIRLDNELHAD